MARAPSRRRNPSDTFPCPIVRSAGAAERSNLRPRSVGIYWKYPLTSTITSTNPGPLLRILSDPAPSPETQELRAVIQNFARAGGRADQRPVQINAIDVRRVARHGQVLPLVRREIDRDAGSRAIRRAPGETRPGIGPLEHPTSGTGVIVVDDVGKRILGGRYIHPHRDREVLEVEPVAQVNRIISAVKPDPGFNRRRITASRRDHSRVISTALPGRDGKREVGRARRAGCHRISRGIMNRNLRRETAR